MNVLAALNALVELTATATNMLASAGQISSILQKAQAEGRTELTAEEWAVVTASDDVSRAALVAAIAKALGGRGTGG